MVEERLSEPDSSEAQLKHEQNKRTTRKYKERWDRITFHLTRSKDQSAEDYFVG